jgi:hypothetical protein
MGASAKCGPSATSKALAFLNCTVPSDPWQAIARKQARTREILEKDAGQRARFRAGRDFG